MKILALKFGPLVALGGALALVIGLIAAQGAGNKPDAISIDLDTTGNTATALGTRDECRQVSAGESIQIDVTIDNAPAANGMIAFVYIMEYDNAVLTVSAKDNAGLLSTAPGYSEIDVGDAVPDSDGTFSGTVADLTAAGASGTGYLQRLTIDVSPSAAPGGYALSLTPGQTGYSGTQTTDGVAPDAENGARLAVGVSCDSLPTPTVAPSNIKGDVDCTGAVNAVDSLKLLRTVAGLNVTQTEPCDDIGTGSPMQGDINCDSQITALDALFVLRFVAQMNVNLPQGCPIIGA